MSYNDIATINEDVLNLPALQAFDIQGNKLKRLPDTVFRHLKQLDNLNLGNNGLEYIGKSLNDLTTLTTLHLRSNSIQDIDLIAISMLPKLSFLDLSRSGFSLATVKVDDGQEWLSPLTQIKLNGINSTDVNDINKLRIFPHRSSN